MVCNQLCSCVESCVSQCLQERSECRSQAGPGPARRQACQTAFAGCHALCDVHCLAEIRTVGAQLTKLSSHLMAIIHVSI
ncbi:hypothetical protein PoB_000305800 [Plakobranchus ocellatus]|uniref:Four-helix bundle copper-binding protein n=1 Tax=Plakobranchus ocellatus TaxID=259542 RepID=A0AAV3Y2S2_9GAST|nr:hypothetical protein PoB_000305800 [Plakobranchus ocellatus]